MLKQTAVNFSSLWGLDPIPGHGLPLRGFAVTLTGHTTFSRTPLNERSARQRDLHTAAHKLRLFTHRTQSRCHVCGTEPVFCEEVACNWICGVICRPYPKESERPDKITITNQVRKCRHCHCLLTTHFNTHAKFSCVFKEAALWQLSQEILFYKQYVLSRTI
jgi:hypothetical protein